MIKKPEKKSDLPHNLYKTSDADAPDMIRDRNGSVVLDLCRDCGRGEAELSKNCAESHTA